MNTRSQQYALSAEAAVSRRLTQAQDATLNKARYGSLAHKLPVLIRTAGLAQALSFVDARGKDEGRWLLDDLALTIGLGGGPALVRQSREAQLSAYMHLARQALDALLWYKRFAQSILDVDATEEGDNG